MHSAYVLPLVHAGIAYALSAILLIILLLRKFVQAIRHASIYKKKKLALGAFGFRGGGGGATNRTGDAHSLYAFMANNTFIEQRSIPFEKYFHELHKYKFLIAPRGYGIQSPKFLEAVAVRDQYPEITLEN